MNGTYRFDYNLRATTIAAFEGGGGPSGLSITAMSSVNGAYEDIKCWLKFFCLLSCQDLVIAFKFASALRQNTKTEVTSNQKQMSSGA